MVGFGILFLSTIDNFNGQCLEMEKRGKFRNIILLGG